MRFSDKLVARLSRVTRSGNLIPEIDGLRFIAIAAVILTHISFTLGAKQAATPIKSRLDQEVFAAFGTGVAGVQLFFAISGFILALPFAEAALNEGRTVNLGKYYRRRVLRIEPPYLINLSILLGGVLLIHGMERSDRIPHYLASIVYLHNLIYNAWSEVNFVAWSLEVEVQFYLIAPALALIFSVGRRGPRRGLLVGLATASAVGATAATDLPFGIRNLLVFHLAYFLVGFLLADLYVADWRGRPRRRAAWDVLATLGLVGFFGVNRLPTLHLLMPPFLLLICIGALRGRFWSRALSNRWVVVFGGMCYTIYLYHFWIWALVHAGLSRVMPVMPMTLALFAYSIVATPLILTACIPFYLLFEKPFMYPDWPSRFRDALGRGWAYWTVPVGASADAGGLERIPGREFEGPPPAGSADVSRKAAAVRPGSEGSPI